MTRLHILMITGCMLAFSTGSSLLLRYCGGADGTEPSRFSGDGTPAEADSRAFTRNGAMQPARLMQMARESAIRASVFIGLPGGEGSFDAWDPALLPELRMLIEQGVSRYRVAGKL